MTARTWHSGPPPHVGWWNASICSDPNMWRWWNGSGWSCAALDQDSSTEAGLCAVKPASRLLAEQVRWSDYYPANAHVPRVDPRTIISDTVVTAARSVMRAAVAKAPIPGQLWQHRGGDRHRVLALANMHSVVPEFVPTVVYIDMDYGLTWSRTLADWLDCMTLIPREVEAGILGYGPTPTTIQGAR